MNLKDYFVVFAAYCTDFSKLNMNNFNDLNTGSLRGDDESNNYNPETWKHALSKMATSVIIPLLVPTATAFAGWLANRRYAAQVKQNEALKQELTRLSEDIRLGQIEAAAYPNVDRSRQTAITREEDQELARINQDLDEISEHLQRRQDIYCSHFTSRKKRHEIEERLKELSFAKSYDKELRLYGGLMDIFQYENHCDSYGSHRNGCMMWVYLDMWRTMARLRKHQRIDSRLRYEESAER